MNKKLDETAKQIGGALIDISALLNKKVEKWSDVSRRPNNLSETECVGFINKETATTGLNLLLDVQAPSDKNEAVLRIWAIESKQGDDQVERFNNIQLDYRMDHSQASELTKKGDAVTRDHIRTALHDQNTQLTRVVVSSQSGFDKAAQQSFGERYDLTINELDGKDNIVENVISALNVVLSTLKESAAIENKL